MSLGVEQFGSVCILGFNSPEWFIAHIAAALVGAKSAGIYTTNAPGACAYTVKAFSLSLSLFVDFIVLKVNESPSALTIHPPTHIFLGACSSVGK